MRRIFSLVLFLLSSWAIGQNCTTYAVVNAFDRQAMDDIHDLKPEDFIAKIGDMTVPVISVTPDFKGRVLVLLEIDGANNDRIEEVVSMATRMTRQAPDGKPVAFGIFAKRSLFTKTFNSDGTARAAEINSVIEESSTLGKRIALYDALHNALAVFGAHQPGDTILLISDGFDDGSTHGGNEVSKELAASGTRLLVELRQQPSHVTGNFMWRSPELERQQLDRMASRSGGAYIMFSADSFVYPWRGYLLGVNLPGESHGRSKWRLRLGEQVMQNHRRAHLSYPERLPGCGNTVAKEKRAPIDGARGFH